MHIDQATQAELLALLASDASFPEKARACQRLARIGDKDSVPALAGCLGAGQVADHARIALQGFPFPEAAAALRGALATLQGPALAGVIDSLACRQDMAAVPAILAFVDQHETGAWSALAKLLTPEAVKAITGGLRQTPGLQHHPAWRAALEGAGRLIDLNRKDEAARLLDALLAAKPPGTLAEAAHSLMERSRAIRLFDGESLTGWEGDSGWFRVAEGAIIAGSMEKPVPYNEFLATTREFGNFELRVKVRLRHRFTNGGIQFRSHRVPGSREMTGYQADAATDYWGGIYDESRRGTFLGTRTEPSKVAVMLNPLGWNSYRIRCEGPRVRLWLNGILTSDFTETLASVPAKGFIAIQIHAGKPTEVDYRDIEITELG
jgi:hypothetical protein